MNIENEYLEKLAKDIADEIDFDVQTSLLGWTKVQIENRFILRFDSLDMDIWCKENCSGKFMSFGNKFVFEKPKDATLFILRWV